MAQHYPPTILAIPPGFNPRARFANAPGLIVPNEPWTSLVANGPAPLLTPTFRDFRVADDRRNIEDLPLGFSVLKTIGIEVALRNAFNKALNVDDNLNAREPGPDLPGIAQALGDALLPDAVLHRHQTNHYGGAPHHNSYIALALALAFYLNPDPELQVNRNFDPIPAFDAIECLQ